MKTVQPRKQRKRLFSSGLKKGVHSHLSKELLKKYSKRSTGLRKGDSVKVLRGKLRGKTGVVESIDLKKQRVFVEGLSMSKADGTKVKIGINPSNVLITSLNLSDKMRKSKLENKKDEIKKKGEKK